MLNVTFPRSGHHLLVECLRAYRGATLHYCEHYTHCRAVPCPDARTNWQKSHDFDLALPAHGGQRRVVQYRHPVDAIASWYRLELSFGYRAERNGRLTARMASSVPAWPRIVRVARPDTPQRWQRFAVEKLAFWSRFVRKWVIDAPDSLAVEYGAFVAAPTSTLMRVAEFAWPEETADEAEIERVVGDVGIRTRPRPRLHPSVDADPSFLAALERSVVEELALVGISRRFDHGGPSPTARSPRMC